MKISVDVEMTPQEARQFLGLPDVEKIQAQLVQNTEKYLADAGAGQYNEMINAAMQPMLAYQQWLGRMMSGGGAEAGKKSRASSKKGSGE